MNTESEVIKPKNDRQLVVNYSKHCVWKNSKNDSGAGANAAASSRRVDMTLSANDPLSEIVWSPDRGLSFNCVDSSFADKGNSLNQDVGSTSSMVLALLQSVTDGSTNTHKPIDDVSVNPITVICAKSGVSSEDNPSRHPSDHQSGVIIPDCKAHKEHVSGSGGNMEKINAAREAINLPNDLKDNLVSYCEKNISDQANIGTSITSEIKGKKSSSISDEPKPSMEQNPSPPKLSNGGIDTGSGDRGVITGDGLCAKVKHIIEYEGSGALTPSSRSSLLEKRESTAENDLQTFNCKANYAATSLALVSMPSEDKNKFQVNEMMQPRDKNLPFNESNEKSLSDGNANKSLSKEENNNRLCVESCYSARLFSKGKKRCNSQQPSITGSKRIKKQIQETSDSKSEAKQQDSSFMNLVSNMMKGFSQSMITCNVNQDPEPENTSFKSYLNSMSGPCLKNDVTTKSHQVGQASSDCKLGNKVHGIDVTPITYFAENNGHYKQASEQYDAGPFLQPRIRPINFFDGRGNRKSNSVENKDCSRSRLSKEKEGMSLQSCPARQDSNSNENGNVESYAQSKRKVTNNIFHRSDTPEDLWMTRFLPKSTASPLITSDHQNEITDRSAFTRSRSHSSDRNNCKIEGTEELPAADDQLLGEAEEYRNCCIDKEASTGLKFFPVTPFPGFSDSEPMASMFARRLGAIKHLPTNRTESIPNRNASSSGSAPPQKLVLSFQPKKF